jgi:hypothetical protein
VGGPLVGHDVAPVALVGEAGALREHGEQGQRDGGDHDEEDPAPRQLGRQPAGDRGADESRQHPRRRHPREHLGPQRIGVGPADHDVERDHHQATAEAGDEPAGQQHREARRQAGHR